MAISGNLHKIVFGGLLAQSETWSCSFHLNAGTDTHTDGGVLESAIEQWMARPTSNVSNLARLDFIKLNRIDPLTGLYFDQANANTYFNATPISGDTAPAAPHLSNSVGTYTAAARGLAHLGRFYPPSGGGNFIQGDGKLTAAAAMAEAVSAAQLMTDINGALSGSLVVFSRIGQIDREILGARVGRVVDVQSRRRKNLLEGYQLAPIS